MKIAITGATGQLGQIVLEELKAGTSKDQLVALVRNPIKAEGLGIETREFNYEKKENLADALKGIDKLLLISSNEVGRRLEQHINVIDAAKKAEVKLIVYTSLLRANTSSLVLAAEHLETEKAIIASGIPYVILRNGWYTENYTGSLSGILSSGVFLGSAGNGKISSASRGDFAAAAAKVLTSSGHEGKTYELAGDKAYTLAEMAAEIAKHSNKSVVYKNLPVDEYSKALVKVGLPEGLAQFLAGTHVATEKGDLFETGHQLSNLIGRPTTPMAETISEALARL